MGAKVKIFEPVGGAPKLNKKSYNTAVYYSSRIWGEDVNETPAEILSRQSECCKAFMKEHPELKKVETYVDRNCVRDADREWLRFLDDVEVRKVDALVINSFHNVSDSYSLVGYFFGYFLYPAGVRIIVIEDDFDSARDDLSQYLQKQVTRQCSYNKQQCKFTRQENNKVFRTAVPYGYVHVPDKEPQIIVDEAVREYVRLIFEKFIAGVRIVDIVNELNTVGAPTPAQRKNELYNRKMINGYFWKNTQVKKILQNPNYTGDYVTGRTRETFYDGKNHCEVLSPDEWLVAKDYHEALVTREEFKLAADRLLSQKFENNHDGEAARRPYRNIFFCAKCGTSMRAVNTGKNNRLPYMRLICDSGRYQKGIMCKRHGFHFDKTVASVVPALMREIEKANQFLDSIQRVRTSAWYHEKLKELEDKYSDAHVQAKSFSDEDTKEIADLHIKAINEAEKEIDNFKNLFSEKNAWAVLLRSADIEAVRNNEKDEIRRLFSKIYVTDEETIEIHTTEDEIYKVLSSYNQEIFGKEGFKQWEDEIEK